MTDNPPSGWYPDPEDPERQRYWNGFQWTEHTAGGDGQSAARAAETWSQPDDADGGGGAAAGALDTSTHERRTTTGAGTSATAAVTTTAATGPTSRAGEIDTWTWQSFVVTLLCGGTFISMIGIYNAGKAEGALATGDRATAAAFARKARNWTLGGLAFGVVGIVVTVLVITVLADFGNSLADGCGGVTPDDGFQYEFCRTLCEQDPAAAECTGFAG